MLIAAKAARSHSWFVFRPRFRAVSQPIFTPPHGALRFSTAVGGRMQ